jgi:hypothetical protein
MDRAIRLDPGFVNGKVVPVKLDGAKLPAKITRPNPLYVDLRNGAADDQWQLLIRQCGGTLRMSASAWIVALDQTKQHLDRNHSVNVVVGGDVDWRAWLGELRATRFSKLAEVDLENPVAVPRPGLIREILRAAGRSRAVPAVPDDLPELASGLMEGGKSYVALRHFHRVADRPQYGPDLFSSLRYLVMDARQLVLLVQTRQPVATLLPPGHALSEIDFKTVELG